MHGRKGGRFSFHHDRETTLRVPSPSERLGLVDSNVQRREEALGFGQLWRPPVRHRNLDGFGMKLTEYAFKFIGRPISSRSDLVAVLRKP